MVFLKKGAVRCLLSQDIRSSAFEAGRIDDLARVRGIDHTEQGHFSGFGIDLDSTMTSCSSSACNKAQTVVAGDCAVNKNSFGPPKESLFPDDPDENDPIYGLEEIARICLKHGAISSRSFRLASLLLQSQHFDRIGSPGAGGPKLIRINQ